MSVQSRRPIRSNGLEKCRLLLLVVHSKPLELTARQPDISKQACRVFVEVQIRFGLDVKDTGLALDQARQPS